MEPWSVCYGDIAFVRTSKVENGFILCDTIVIQYFIVYIVMVLLGVREYRIYYRYLIHVASSDIAFYVNQNRDQHQKPIALEIISLRQPTSLPLSLSLTLGDFKNIGPKSPLSVCLCKELWPECGGSYLQIQIILVTVILHSFLQYIQLVLWHRLPWIVNLSNRDTLQKMYLFSQQILESLQTLRAHLER